MALRAVIFDYGMVLSGPPDPKSHAELMRITGLPAEKLDPLYWADRHAFDEGKLTGEAYWRDILHQAGLTLPPSAVEELIYWDGRMWMTLNPPMLAWAAALKVRGLLTAILSNIGDTTQQAMERELKWLTRFDVLVWSYQLRIAKPDPAIYRYALEKLGTQPAETLFIDDREVNVEAAAALGMKALLFSTTAQLRADLIEQRLDNELPLP
ncbi:MAG TPA: HAD family phosphatase [Terracidiphilus sp.]|nr:HAD family phosphatase [Terracidiphilus sp.]